MIFAGFAVLVAGENSSIIGGLPTSATQPAGGRNITDQDAWIVHFRLHKDLYP